MRLAGHQPFGPILLHILKRAVDLVPAHVGSIITPRIGVLAAGNRMWKTDWIFTVVTFAWSVS
jgi:hypothetical protein